MPKNLLVISSSPRREGNSDLLCDAFLKGALDSGNTGEKIFLKDKKINYCTGCGLCESNNHSKCSIQDDMTDLLHKMQIADVIVFSTPLYFYSISGQMKTFIDRCCARCTHIKNKEFYYIVTASNTSYNAIEVALSDFKGFLMCVQNPIEKGCLFAGGVWHKGDVCNTQYLNEAYELGASI